MATLARPAGRDVRVVEGDGFEIRCTVFRYRGFESLSLRFVYFFFFLTLERCPSGRRCTLGRGVSSNRAPRVRIPLSPYSFPLGVDGRFCAIALRPTPSGPEGSSGKRLNDEPQPMYRSQGGFSFSHPRDIVLRVCGHWRDNGIRSYSYQKTAPTVRRLGRTTVCGIHHQEFNRTGKNRTCLSVQWSTRSRKDLFGEDFGESAQL